MKPTIIAPLLLLAGCSPVNVQNWFVTKAPDGGIIHHYTGYTNLGEDKQDDSRKYLQKALQEQCGGPARITQLNEWHTHNGFGKFLYWAGEGQCDKR